MAKLLDIARHTPAGLHFTSSKLLTDYSFVASCGTPFAAVLDPFGPLESEAQISSNAAGGSNTHAVSPIRVARAPVRCRWCGAIMCHASVANMEGNEWMCVYCGTNNALTESESNVLSMPETTPGGPAIMEFVDPSDGLNESKPLCPPTIVFVLDLNLQPRHLEAVKDAMVASLQVLDTDAAVGFITYGASVKVYRLNSHESMHADVVPGRQGPSRQAFSRGHLNPQVHTASIIDALDEILELLQSVSCGGQNGNKSSRAMGAALEAAVLLCSNSVGAVPARGQLHRVVVISGGPPSYGLGAMPPASSSKDRAAEWQAKEELSELAKRYLQRHTCVDMYMCTAGDAHVGILEPFCTSTGGSFLLVQDYSSHMTANLHAGLARCQGRNCKMRFYTTDAVEVEYLIGPSTSNSKDSAAHLVEFPSAESRIGYTILYSLEDDLHGTYCPLQFEVSFINGQGERVLRLFQVRIPLVRTKPEYVASLDPKIGSLVLAKKCAYVAHIEGTIAARKLLNQNIRAIAERSAPQMSLKFAPGSLAFPRAWVPHLYSMYLLQRGAILGDAIQHTDDAWVQRIVFAHHNSRVSDLTLCPRLFLAEEPSSSRCVVFNHEVPMSESELKSDCAFLMDAGDAAYLWFGSQCTREVSSAHSGGDAALSRIPDRHPFPHAQMCKEGSSAERWMLARMIPARSQNAQGPATSGFLNSIMGIVNYVMPSRHTYTDDLTFEEWATSLGIIVSEM